MADKRFSIGFEFHVYDRSSGFALGSATSPHLRLSVDSLDGELEQVLRVSAAEAIHDALQHARRAAANQDKLRSLEQPDEVTPVHRRSS